MSTTATDKKVGIMTTAVSSGLLSNYTYQKVWDEITYPFPNFNSATIEVGNA